MVVQAAPDRAAPQPAPASPAAPAPAPAASPQAAERPTQPAPFGELRLPLIRSGRTDLQLVDFGGVFPFESSPFSPVTDAARAQHCLTYGLPSGAPAQSTGLPRMPEEQRTQFLAGLSAEARERYETAERWQKLRQHLSPREIDILGRQGLTSEQLDRVIADLDKNGAPRPTTPCHDEQLKFQILEKAPQEMDAALGTLTDRDLASFFGTCSQGELDAMPQEIRQKHMQRLSTNPDLYVAVQQRGLVSRRDDLATIGRGAQTNADEARRELGWSILPSTRRGFRDEMEGFTARRNAANAAEVPVSEALDRSMEYRRVANIMDRLAASERQQGHAAEAQGAETRAARLYSASSTALFERELPQFDAEAGVAQIRHAGTEFAGAARFWDGTERVMRTTRNACVVVVAGGVATLAAPVVFTAVAGAGFTGSTVLGIGASTVAGTGIGAATGFGYGGLTSALEGSGHVLLGNKDGATALRDGWQQTINDTRSGAYAGMAGGAGGGIGAALNPAGATLGVLPTLRNGAVSAGGSSLITTGVSMGERLYSVNEEFNKLAAQSNWNADQRAVAYASFLKQHGITPAELAKEGGMNFLVSSLCGGMGARFQIARGNAANAGLLRNAAIEGGEWTMSSLIGFSRAYFDTPQEQRTFENMLCAATDQIAQNTVAGFQGRASAGGARRNPSAPADGSPAAPGPSGAPHAEVPGPQPGSVHSQPQPGGAGPHRGAIGQPAADGVSGPAVPPAHQPAAQPSGQPAAQPDSQISSASGQPAAQPASAAQPGASGHERPAGPAAVEPAPAASAAPGANSAPAGPAASQPAGSSSSPSNQPAPAPGADMAPAPAPDSGRSTPRRPAGRAQDDRERRAQADGFRSSQPDLNPRGRPSGQPPGTVGRTPGERPPINPRTEASVARPDPASRRSGPEWTAEPPVEAGRPRMTVGDNPNGRDGPRQPGSTRRPAAGVRDDELVGVGTSNEPRASAHAGEDDHSPTPGGRRTGDDAGPGDEQVSGGGRTAAPSRGTGRQRSDAEWDQLKRNFSNQPDSVSHEERAALFDRLSTRAQLHTSGLTPNQLRLLQSAHLADAAAAATADPSLQSLPARTELARQLSLISTQADVPVIKQGSSPGSGEDLRSLLPSDPAELRSALQHLRRLHELGERAGWLDSECLAPTSENQQVVAASLRLMRDNSEVQLHDALALARGVAKGGRLDDYLTEQLEQVRIPAGRDFSAEPATVIEAARLVQDTLAPAGGTSRIPDNNRTRGALHEAFLKLMGRDGVTADDIRKLAGSGSEESLDYLRALSDLRSRGCTIQPEWVRSPEKSQRTVERSRQMLDSEVPGDQVAMRLRESDQRAAALCTDEMARTYGGKDRAMRAAQDALDAAYALAADEVNLPHGGRDRAALVREYQERMSDILTAPAGRGCGYSADAAVQFVSDISRLNQAGVPGTSRVARNLHENRVTSDRGDPIGFIDEARNAARLIDAGWRVSEMSATEHGVDIDIHALNGRQRCYIEVKHSLEAFIRKNEQAGPGGRVQAAPDSQIVRLARAAGQDQAEVRVIVEDFHDTPENRQKVKDLLDSCPGARPSVWTFDRRSGELIRIE